MYLYSTILFCSAQMGSLDSLATYDEENKLTLNMAPKNIYITLSNYLMCLDVS